jgi:hypothetical protein
VGVAVVGVVPLLLLLLLLSFLQQAKNKMNNKPDISESFFKVYLFFIIQN